MIRGVAPDDGLNAVWPQAWPLLAPAAELWRGRYDEPSLRVKVGNGDMQLWVTTEGARVTAACLTAVARYPTGITEANVEVVGGSGAGEWCDRMRAIEKWAASLGCRFVTCRGRQGWERILKPAGFGFDCTVLSKEC